MNFEERLYSAIGKRIRKRRRELRMTQGELAEQEHVGLTRTSITNIEYGQQRLQIHTLYAIADAMGMYVCDLLPDIEVEEDKTVEELVRDAAVASTDDKRGLEPSERQLIVDLLTKE